MVHAINQTFELFRAAYPQQFLKAFGAPGSELDTTAKQIWLRYLKPVATSRIYRAADQCIRQEKFLPNLHTFLERCEPQPAEFGLPDAKEAYKEACMKPSPKAEQSWSHPAVYHAGRNSDWFYLSSTSEHQAFPVFERHYALLCERVMNGETINIDLPKAIPETIKKPLTKDEQKAHLKELREKIGI